MDPHKLPPFVHADATFLRLYEESLRRAGTIEIDCYGTRALPHFCRTEEGTFIKRARPDSAHLSAALEAVTIHLVSTQTTIPVPTIRRILLGESFDDTYLEMELIEGVDVADLWPSASWWTRLKIIWTLRSYIRQLRHVKSPFPSTPGPIHPAGTPQPCYGSVGFSDDGAGPFPTYEDFVAHFNMCRGVSLQYDSVKRLPPLEIRDNFDSRWPLVLTHGDLHLGNLRLGKDGKLYLLDWGWSGLYPVWFESWYLKGRCDPRFAPESFCRFYWLIAGWYPRQYRFMEALAAGFRWAYSTSWRLDQPADKVTLNFREHLMSLTCPTLYNRITVVSDDPRRRLYAYLMSWTRGFGLFLEACICYPFQ